MDLVHQRRVRWPAGTAGLEWQGSAGFLGTHMFIRISSAGVTVDEKHGLVDCGPRRLDPEADWFRLREKSACELKPFPPVKAETNTPSESQSRTTGNN